MEIKKTIKLCVFKRKNTIICRYLDEVCLCLGTKAVSGNFSLYGVRRDINGKYIIPIEKIKERIKVLESRKAKIEESVEIMKQVV